MKLKQLMDFEMDKNKKSSLQVKAVKALAGVPYSDVFINDSVKSR